MTRSMIAITCKRVVCELLFLATPALACAQADQAARQGPAASEPGVLVRLYDIGVDVAFLPELAPGQKPNVVKVVPTLDLQLERKDFEPLANNFMTEVVGVLWIQQAGLYTFRLISDDGSKLWIDGKLVVDHDGLHAPDPKDGKVELTATRHELKILHFQGGGGAQLTLQWRPAGAQGDQFELVPEGVLGHAADASRETAPGKKKFIPPLRRGRPGDGRPIDSAHPSFDYSTVGLSGPDAEVGDWVKDGHLRSMQEHPEGGTVPPVAWLPIDGQAFFPFKLRGTSYAGQLLVPHIGGEGKRVQLDDSFGKRQGCVFRFGRIDMSMQGGQRATFEMLAIHAVPNGFEIEFTKPLHKRVGWEADSYYIEQWPFSVEGTEARGHAGTKEKEPEAQARVQPPTRDGVVYPVKSASVSADRKKVFLEIADLKASHVIYVRLLPPCVSEDGELPWSTEAWYTLNAIPKDRAGQVLTPPKPEPQNFLTEEEKQQGWRLLFDGQTPKGWHGFRKDSFPAGWRVLDGCLVRVGPAGDIVTDDDFGDFDLSIEWRVSAAANSGIMYRVTEDHDAPWQTGPEYQILDNAEHPDGRNVKTSAASCYALYAPVKDATAAVGLFNQGRIVCKGNHVEHWLNGVKVVEYELNSPEWNQLVKESKFGTMPDYGRRPRGKIDLQDHGDKVWYRNIKIRLLK